MNGKGWTIAGFAALIAALAANGSAVIDVIVGLVKVPQAFATGLPFGLASFLLSLAISALVWYRADGRLRVGKGGEHGRGFAADAIALLMACAVTMAQAAVKIGPTPGALLQALMLGILAGLLSPLLVKGALALVRRSQA